MQSGALNYEIRSISLLCWEPQEARKGARHARVSIHIHPATGRKAVQTGSQLNAPETLEKGRTNVLTPGLWTGKINIASCDSGRY